jgi:hypothetical protein
MIVSDDRKWSLCHSVIYDRHLTLASIVNYDRKWYYNLERYTSGVNYDRNKFIIQATDDLEKIAQFFWKVAKTASKPNNAKIQNTLKTAYLGENVIKL